ncbi:MAG: DNA repair protein RadA [Thermoanaerobaculia bacterium]|nr:DNA repair protein RadA [Thermoanaerobaculia bacterium]
MKRATSWFICSECGHQSRKWLGHCPDCSAWNSFVEESASPGSAGGLPSIGGNEPPKPISEVRGDDSARSSTGLETIDRVIGGGLVPGAVILVGGEPGIGKSTLLLQLAQTLSRSGRVLYVSGEESPGQIATRARRLDALSDSILLFSETSVEKILDQIEKTEPAAVIVDSIQTTYSAKGSGSAGSIAQIRESAGQLMTLAKRKSVPIFLIGHVTKDGSLAGPKTLEHIVDTVLYFEGDRARQYRIARATKNRFGPVNEVAIFEMHETGLEEVTNPSAVMLAERSHEPGSVITATVEGTRPLLVEIQALATPTHYPAPKRMATGIDGNRLSLLLAVLEKKSGIDFVNHDVYVNVAGGLELDEPAIDLAVVAALASSRRNRPLPDDLVVFGEVGLLGEVRGVSQADLRAREAASLGFARLALPESNRGEVRQKLKLEGVRTVDQFLKS